MKIEKQNRVSGNVSGFDIDLKSIDKKLIYPFSKDMYKNMKNTWHRKNTWLNLGNWLLVTNILKYPNPPSFLDRGISYFALGEGNPSWDGTPEAVSENSVKLFNETYRTKLHPSNFRCVVMSEQVYDGYDDLRKIKIDSTIPTQNYKNYIGNTLQIKTDDASGTEERFIIGYINDHWLLDTELNGEPTGDNYYIFIPFKISKENVDLMKELDKVHIEVEIIISSDDANGDIREFAFFGGWATEEKDTGLICNTVRHSLIQKEPLHWISRRVRFEFS